MHKIIALAVMSSITTVYAEGAGLSWRACLEEASQHNAELKAAEATLRASQAASKAAISGFLPQLSANAGLTKSKSDQNGVTSSTAWGNEYNAGLTLTQNIFSGFSDQAKVAQADANTEAAVAALDDTRAKVRSDLMNAFASMLYAQESGKLAADILRRRQENLHLVELRFASGRENKGSVLLSEAYLKQANYESLLAEHRSTLARADLAQILGRDDHDQISVSGELPLSLPSNQDNFEALVASIPSHKSAVAREKNAAASVSANRAGFYPTLSLTAGIIRNDDHWFPGEQRKSIGLALTIPIFSGGRDYHLTQSAIETYDAAITTRVDQDRTILNNLRSYLASFSEAVEKLKVDESFLQAANVRAEIARNKYNNGLLDFDDWDVVENDLITRQKTVIQSRRDRIMAESAFGKTLGKGLELESIAQR